MTNYFKFDSTDHVLTENRLFSPDQAVVENSNIYAYMQKKGFSDYKDFYNWSLANREEFWGDQANELHWFEPFTKVLDDSQKPYFQWFTGGKFNITYNCLDRHIGTPTENKVAYYWEGDDGTTRTITYGEVFQEVNRLAAAMQKLGVTKGDRIAIYMPAIPEQLYAVLACARLGAAHSVVFGGFAASALRDRINDCEARMLITADGNYRGGKLVDLKKIADEALAETPTIQKVIVAQRLNNNCNMKAGRDIFWKDALADFDKDVVIPAEPMDSEDMLYILYTSGSTGKPKGVVHVQAGYAVGVYSTTRLVFDIKPDDIFWCTADVGWVTGHSYVIYGPLMTGVTSVMFEGIPTFPEPDRWWSLIEKYKVTIIYTAPTAIRARMREGEKWPQKHDMTSLRLLGTVGEPINPEAWIWYRENIGANKLPVIDTWWQTETGGHMITPTIALPLKPGSASWPFPTIEADVVDKDGNSVGSDKGGFLIIRQPWPSQMRMIYGDKARYETYWNTIEGVYFAGDAAHKDADGYFWIQGRVDDVIKVSGHRLGSMEIESSLVSHPAVAEAAAIGKPDDIKGEHVKVFVILKSGFEPSDELMKELKLHVRTNVGPVAVPDELEFTPSLPKTRSGKIMRRVIRAKELGEPVGDTSTLDG
jgi:acetyl-CoA synthetase